MKALRRYSHIGLGLSLVAGLVLAAVLCLQCIRTYLSIGSVFEPQQAERDAERHSGALSAAAHSAGVTDVHELEPIMRRMVETESNGLFWMRILDPDSQVVAQAGAPPGRVTVPSHWWEQVEKHESLGRVVVTPKGKAFAALLPFRMPRPPHSTENQNFHPGGREHGPPEGRRPVPYMLDVGVSLDSVAAGFAGLRRDLIVGLLASVALLAAVIVIGIRTPHYLRGKYLERELQLARQVQSDLQPQPSKVSPYVEFAASADAADHVGGDFYDIFETAGSQVAIVLGDVSGKGISAALLVSVLHGAIRSASGSQHEVACERINKMLCERTATERFATLFWGVCDPLTATLRYVNAGHAGPILMRAGSHSAERLTEGGPVLGVLPAARYRAGTVQVEPGDTLIVFSDGVNEAANLKKEEFGEERMIHLVSGVITSSPDEICQRIISQVKRFAPPGAPSDDRTLMVVRFPVTKAALTA